MGKNELREEISGDEFMEILQMGGIKIKRLTVGGHSTLDGIELKWTSLPKNILIGPLVRKEKVILADGDTKLRHGDDLIIFGNEEDLVLIKELLVSTGFLSRIKRSVLRSLSRGKNDKQPDQE